MSRLQRNVEVSGHWPRNFAVPLLHLVHTGRVGRDGNRHKHELTQCRGRTHDDLAHIDIVRLYDRIGDCRCDCLRFESDAAVRLHCFRRNRVSDRVRKLGSHETGQILVTCSLSFSKPVPQASVLSPRAVQNFQAILHL